MTSRTNAFHVETSRKKRKIREFSGTLANLSGNAYKEKLLGLRHDRTQKLCHTDKKR